MEGGSARNGMTGREFAGTILDGLAADTELRVAFEFEPLADDWAGGAAGTGTVALARLSMFSVFFNTSSVLTC